MPFNVSVGLGRFYTAIGLNSNNEQRHVRAQMVEGGPIQRFVTSQY